MQTSPLTLSRALFVAALAAVGLAIVVYGFAFGAKPRPGTDDDAVGLCISALGAAFVGIAVSLLWQPNPLRHPGLALTLAFLSPGVYFLIVQILLWGYVIGNALILRMLE